MGKKEAVVFHRRNTTALSPYVIPFHRQTSSSGGLFSLCERRESLLSKVGTTYQVEEPVLGTLFVVSISEL